MSTLLRGFPRLLLLFSAKKHIAFTKPTQTAAIFSTYYIIRATPPLGAQKTNAHLHHPKNPQKRITYSKKTPKTQTKRGAANFEPCGKKRQNKRPEANVLARFWTSNHATNFECSQTSPHTTWFIPSPPLGGARGGGCEAVGGVGGASGIGARKEKHINMKQDSNHATNFEPCGGKRLISDTL